MNTHFTSALLAIFLHAWKIFPRYLPKMLIVLLH